MHRGILAIGRNGEPASTDVLFSAVPRYALVTVPVGISNHDNIGLIFRNAAALGTEGCIAQRNLL